MTSATSVIAAPAGRLGLNRRRLATVGAPTGAVVLALLLGAGLIVAAGGDPLSAYSALLDGAFGNPLAFGEVLAQATPLVIIGLGLALAFRGGVWNIGAEGQLFVGALTGGAVAVELPVSSGPVLIAAALVGGIIGGAVWGLIVGVLRARWGVNEVITSLLLTYIGILLFQWAVRQPLRDPAATNGLSGQAMPHAALLPDLPGVSVHIGVLFALVLVPVVAWLMGRTPFGFRLRMLGLNADAAQTAGVPAGRMAIRLMVISGGLAGLAGIVQTLGVSDRLDPNLSVGTGFTAIVVALIGRCNAIGVLLAGLLVATLQAGGQAMSVTESLPYSIVLAIEGVFVVFLLIADRLARR
ncbi:MAG: ABC transporter permease [Solirubrobacterales bacterium]